MTHSPNRPPTSSLPDARSGAATKSELGATLHPEAVPVNATPNLPPANIDSVAELLKLLHHAGLLSREHLTEFESLHKQVSEPRALASALIQRGWVSPYQINQVNRGEGRKLVLGSYVLIERLGEGGMGQVFKAYHRVMQRYVALKIIRPEHCTNPAACQRFLVEIRALAQLSHPNIIQVYDAGEVDSTLYFAMECVAGTDLAKLVAKNHPLAVSHVCAWLRQAALGLQHAHERGLVHRDLKPSNLLLATPLRSQDGKQAAEPIEAGTVKLLDLGLVRMRQTADPPETAEPLTHSGAIMGTPDYMAPEQLFDAHSVDIRGDVYSLGCTLYHLLAGRAPFAGLSLADKFRGHQTLTPPALEQVRQDLPVGLAAVCERMMAKEPERRYQTPQAVADALSPFCPMSGSTAPLPPTCTYQPAPSEQVKRRSPLLARTGWIVAGLALASVFLLGSCFASVAVLLHIKHRLEGADSARLVDKDNRDKSAPDKDNPGPPPERPPIGEVPPDKPEPPVVVPRIDPWAPEHHLKTLGDTRGRHWGAVRAVASSPDGHWLASSVQLSPGQNRLYLWDAKTLREQVVHNNASFITALAFAPDNQTFAAVNGRASIQLWEIQDGKLAKGPLLEMPEESKHRQFGSILFTTDGQGLLSWDSQGAIWRWKRQSNRWNLDLTTQPLSPPSADLTISADGKTVAYFVSGRGTGKVEVWVKALERPKEEPRQVDTSLSRVGGLALSDDGRRLAFGSGSDVRIWDLTGAEPRKLPTIKAPTGEPTVWRLSYDGSSLLFVESNPTSRRPDQPLWVCAVKEQKAAEPVELKGACAMVGAVSFTGDGNTLAVGGWDHALRVWDRAGNEWRLRPEFAGHAGPIRDVAFSPDGNQVVALSRVSAAPEYNEASNLRIWNVDKGDEACLIPVNGWFQQARFVDDKQVLACGMDMPAQGPNRFVRQAFLGCWDSATGRELTRRLYPAQNCRLSASRDGKTVALACLSYGADSVRLLTLPTLEKRGEPLKAVVNESLALFADGSILALPATVNLDLVRSNYVLKFWDLGDLDKKPPKEVTIPPDRTLEFGKQVTALRHLEFSADGKLLVALAKPSPFPNEPLQVWLWDLKKGKEQVLQEGDKPGDKPHACTAVALAPDGKLLATCGADQTLTLWDTATAKKVYQWEFPGPVTSVCFDGQGKRLAAGNSNGTVSLLRVPER